jgi:ketosteroid isomerase-like protein
MHVHARLVSANQERNVPIGSNPVRRIRSTRIQLPPEADRASVTPQDIPEDLGAVKDWLRELAEHVRAVDFAAARHLFAEDFVAFGTFTDFVIGRDLAENNQWRNVWPTIDSFVWRLDDAKALVSPDRLFAVGLAVWDSTGYHPDGKPFERKGRATVSFTRAKVGDPWVASHTHMSLFRGTPDVSHGMKPSKS